MLTLATSHTSYETPHHASKSSDMVVLSFCKDLSYNLFCITEY